MITTEASSNMQRFSQGITFHHMREDKNLYCQPKSDKQKMLKFIRESSLEDNRGVETVKKKTSDRTLVKNALLEALKSTSKIIESFQSSPRHSSEKLPHSRLHIDSGLTTKILPQISPRNDFIKSKSETPLHRRKNLSVESEKLRLNIPTKISKHIINDPLTDPNRRLLSNTELSEHVSSKGQPILAGHNGIMISAVKLDSYKISESATEYKDLYRNSNPAYDLTMPKDSGRRKNVMQKMNLPSHDISHLADLNASNRKVFKNFLDKFQTESHDFILNDSIQQNSSKSTDNNKKVHRNSDDIKNLFSKNLNDILLHKASNFLALSATSPQHNEVHSALKMEIKRNMNLFVKSPKRSFSEDRSAVSNSPFTTHNVSQVDIKDQKQATSRAEIVTQATDEAAEFSRNLLQSLKARLPNVSNDAPSGRTEVVILSNWLTSSVEQVSSHSKLSLTEKLYRTDEIYSLTLNELIRQISGECLERGELFMKLWKKYISLHNGIISDIKRHFRDQEKCRSEELNRIRDGFKDQLELKDKEIEELIKSSAELRAKCETLSTELKDAGLRYDQFNSIVNNLKTKVKGANKQSDILRKEYQDIALKYKKLLKEKHLQEEEFDQEEIICAKLVGMQKSESNTEIASSVLDLELKEPELSAKADGNQFNNKTAGFGAFVGKKLEFADKKTEIDRELFFPLKAEVETQTELILVDPQYDALFDNMEKIEDLRKEELLRQEIQEENVRNLEEDLQEAMIEQKMPRIHLTKIKETDDLACLSGEVMNSRIDASIDSHEMTSMQFENDNLKERRRRRSSISQASVEDKFQIDSENHISLNDLDDDPENQSYGSSLEISPENIKGRLIKEEKDQDEESKSSTKKFRGQNELHLELRPTASKSVDAIRKRTMSIKAGKITLHTSNFERPVREEVSSPIQENIDEYATSPGKIRSAKKQVTYDPAYKIQQRIAEKVRALDEKRGTKKSGISEGPKFSVTQLQGHVRELFDEDNGQKIDQTKDQQSQKLEENTEKNTESSSGLGKGKYFENMILNQVKYIRLMRMLKVEKSKAKELEQKQQALTLVVNQDEQILDKIKEIVEEIKTNSNENLDKGKLLRVLKDLQNRKKVIDAIKDSNNNKINEDLGGNKFISRVDNRSKTTNALQQPHKLEHRMLTSSKGFDDEPGEKKKADGGPNFSTKKADQKLTIFKTNFLSAHAAALNSLGTSTLTASGPLLGRKRDTSINYRKPNAITEAMNRLGKILKKKIKTKDLIPLKKILKSITSFLIDKVAASHDNAVVKEQDMATFIYTSFVNTYGAAKFAESKYIKFMASLKKYTSIHRIATFVRLCGLSDLPNNWTSDESKQFFIGLEFLLTQKNIGVTIANPETEKRHYTPFVRAIEYARQFCEKRNISSELATLKKELEKEKEPDNAGPNRAGKIRIDLFLEFMVDLYQKHKERSKEQLKWVFEACNFLGKKTLGFDEICVLVKYIEPEKFDLKKLEEMYNLNEEYVNSENVGITLNKFVVLAIDSDLFSIEKQRRFVLAADENEIAKNFDSIQEIWGKKKERLEQIIEYNERVCEPEVLTFWTVALGSFDNEIREPTIQKKIYLLMKYRILILEMNATFAANIPLL